MACPSCAIADIDPLTGHYHIGCDECSTRQIAHGQEHWTSQAARRILPAYQSLLESTFGPEWQAGHMKVKAWSQRIDAARAGVKSC